MLKFSGTVKGVKSVPRHNKNNGETWEEIFLGVSEPKEGGYGGEEIIHDVKLTKQCIESGMRTYYENLVGKRVEIPVFITARAWNGKAYMDWFLSGEGRPISVEGKPPQVAK